MPAQRTVGTTHTHTRQKCPKHVSHTPCPPCAQTPWSAQNTPQRRKLVHLIHKEQAGGRGVDWLDELRQRLGAPAQQGIEGVPGLFWKPVAPLPVCLEVVLRNVCVELLVLPPRAIIARLLAPLALVFWGSSPPPLLSSCSSTDPAPIPSAEAPRCPCCPCPETLAWPSPPAAAALALVLLDVVHALSGCCCCWGL